MAQQVKILTSIHKDTGSIPGLVQWVRIRCCPELWCRSQTQLGSSVAMALWLWRQAAKALISPLAWELPYTMGTALKREEKKLQTMKSMLSGHS